MSDLRETTRLSIHLSNLVQPWATAHHYSLIWRFGEKKSFDDGLSILNAPM